MVLQKVNLVLYGTNLLTAFEAWTKWVDGGYGADIVYLDYKKAFD